MDVFLRLCVYVDDQRVCAPANSQSSIKSGPRSHLLRSSVIRDPSMEDPLSNSLKLSHSAVGSSGSLRGSKGEEDFRPHLNSRSEQLARQARPRDSDLYEVGHSNVSLCNYVSSVLSFFLSCFLSVCLSVFLSSFSYLPLHERLRQCESKHSSVKSLGVVLGPRASAMGGASHAAARSSRQKRAGRLHIQAQDYQ